MWRSLLLDDYTSGRVTSVRTYVSHTERKRRSRRARLSADIPRIVVVYSFVASLLVRHSHCRVVHTSDNVEATGNKVTSCFDNVASTLLLVWTGLNVAGKRGESRRGVTTSPPATPGQTPPSSTNGTTLAESSKLCQTKLPVTYLRQFTSASVLGK